MRLRCTTVLLTLALGAPASARAGGGDNGTCRATEVIAINPDTGAIAAYPKATPATATGFGARKDLWGSYRTTRLITSDAAGYLYAVRTDGTLHTYRRTATGIRHVARVSASFGTARQIVSTDPGTVLVLRGDGTLRWYRINSARTAWVTSKLMKTGLDPRSMLGSGGHGLLYQVRSDGILVWRSNPGAPGRAGAWSGPRALGTGWAGYNSLVGLGDGVLIGWRRDGSVWLHNHVRAQLGERTWSADSGTRIGGGWAYSRLRTATPGACTAHPDITYADLAAIGGGAVTPFEQPVREGLPTLNEQLRRAGMLSPARKSAVIATIIRESNARYNAVQYGYSYYRGRGYVQLTGSANYSSAGRALGVNLLGDPSLAASQPWSARILRWYWTVARPVMNAAADAHDMRTVNRSIGYARSYAEDIRRCTLFQDSYEHYTGVRPNVVC